MYCQVKEVDGDDSKYWAMINAPVVASNQVGALQLIGALGQT
jgi:hypothetical protein